MEMTELNETERNIILLHRERVALHRQREALCLEILRVAYFYNNWLQEHKLNNKLVAFNEFGHTENGNSELFDAVTSVIIYAKEEAKHIQNQSFVKK